MSEKDKTIKTPALSRHVLVTGGGSGIGAAIAKRFQEKGWAVTIAGRNEERLRAQANRIKSSYQVMDVTDPEAIQRGFEAAQNQIGPIGVLVNNAGAAEAMPFMKTDFQQFQKTLAVNLEGVFLCTQAAIPGMLNAGAGRVVNIASTAALTGYAYVSAYCAAKHGVLGLTRALALEFARKNITINAVCPGYTDTDIIQNSIQKIVSATGRSAEEALQEFVKVNPQQRLIQPEEVAHTAYWLCEEASASITGQAIAVAGGEVL